MTSSLQDKTALVTGGSRGIGRAIVERLAADGASVVFSYATNKAAADEVLAAVRAAGSRGWAVRADFTDRDAAKQLYDTAEKHLGGIDILVNNAGSATRPVSIADTTDADYEKLMTVNTWSVFALMREAHARLRDGGRIVNISTLNTVSPIAEVAVHAASKAAVEQFTACAARDLGARGITVNSVSPGATDTDLLRSNNPGVDLEQALVPITPLRRLGQPGDIAAVVAFLAGPDGAWMTGQNLRASGGLP
jgi:3-oxoacyl-[acyl-carrier protein] reductase